MLKARTSKICKGNVGLREVDWTVALLILPLSISSRPAFTAKVSTEIEHG